MDGDDDHEWNDSLTALAPEVESAMTEVLGVKGVIQSAEFNPIDYINKLFPTEQSLSGVDAVVAKLRNKIRKLDVEITEAIHIQADSGEEGMASVLDTQAAISELFTKIKAIRQKAELSEMMVQEITRDIKSLDYAKKNLTLSINTLNHMHMLIGGVTSLKDMARHQQYRDAANLLQAITNIMAEFEPYKNIPKIRSLAQEVQKVKTELKKQVWADFEASFSSSKLNGSAQHLQEACGVVDVLGDGCRQELIDWFVRLHLSDYRVFFHDGQEVSSLEKLDRRYAWLKRTVVACEEDCSNVFPPSWRVGEALCLQFCVWCRKDLHTLLEARKDTLDAKLLLQLIQKTVNFEKHLTTRFGHPPSHSAPLQETDGAPNQSDLPVSRIDSSVQQGQSKFTGSISSCFESYMYIYIDDQDRKLVDIVESYVKEAKTYYKDMIDGKEDNISSCGPAKVLTSSSDLFFLFKNCLVQCASLNIKEPLCVLSKVFGKHLQSYANKVLTARLPGTRQLSNLAGTGYTRLSPQEEFAVCSIFNTAEYCLETTKQLENKMKEKVDASSRLKIGFGDELDAFHKVISSALQLLVKNVEVAAETMCNELLKVNWATVTEVGDSSPYVVTFAGALKRSIPVVRNGVAAKYFNNYCLKIANVLLPRYIMTLHKCRDVTAVAAEQLLLDEHSIKEVLLNIHSIESDATAQPPQSYTKYVVKCMAKAEMTLKVIMTPPSPCTPFVQNFLALMPEKDFGTFRKLVEMKSLRKSEEQALYDEFAKATGISKEDQLATSNPLHRDTTPTDFLLGAGGESTRLKRLEEFINKFQ